MFINPHPQQVLMNLPASIQTTLDGRVLLEIEVKPSSTRQGIIGFNKWRSRLQVAVKAHAEKGKANHAVCNLMATVLGTEVEIISGHTSRKKRLSVCDLSAEQIIEKLEEACE